MKETTRTHPTTAKIVVSAITRFFSFSISFDHSESLASTLNTLSLQCLWEKALQSTSDSEMKPIESPWHIKSKYTKVKCVWNNFCQLYKNELFVLFSIH